MLLSRAFYVRGGKALTAQCVSIWYVTLLIPDFAFINRVGDFSFKEWEMQIFVKKIVSPCQFDWKHLIEEENSTLTIYRNNP